MTTQRLTRNEMREHTAACGLPTDAERQAAWNELSERIRTRLNIPSNRFYTFHILTGDVVIDTKRDRPIPVKKISKSDQP